MSMYPEKERFVSIQLEDMKIILSAQQLLRHLAVKLTRSHSNKSFVANDWFPKTHDNNKYAVRKVVCDLEEC